MKVSDICSRVCIVCEFSVFTRKYSVMVCQMILVYNVVLFIVWFEVMVAYLCVRAETAITRGHKI